MTVLGAKLYAVGGQHRSDFNGRPEHLSCVERFDPETGEWEEVAPIRTARSRMGVAALQGKLYAVGGKGEPPLFDDPISTLDSVECYDPESGAWQEVCSLTEPRSRLTVTAVP